MLTINDYHVVIMTMTMMMMTQGCSDWSVTLSNVLDNCPQLHTLDLSSLHSAVTDAFIAELCDKAIHLRRLALSLDTSRPLSADVLTALVQVCHVFIHANKNYK